MRYLLHLLVQGHQGPLLFSGVIIAEEADGVVENGSGDTTTVDVQTFLQRSFLHMSVKSACFTDESFCVRKQNFQCWNYSLELDFQGVWIIR
jgi:hypothetical protein